MSTIGVTTRKSSRFAPPDRKARGATLYVTLEPCCTTGRTGPCTKAIIAAGVKHVYAAIKDPNPRVAGRGLAELNRAGIKVEVGEHEEAARTANEDFAKWIRTGLPFVTLKTALTLDGQIAARAGSTTWITSKESHAAVQRMRHAADALLTGIGTVLADDPRMTDRTRQAAPAKTSARRGRFAAAPAAEVAAREIGRRRPARLHNAA